LANLFVRPALSGLAQHPQGRPSRPPPPENITHFFSVGRRRCDPEIFIDIKIYWLDKPKKVIHSPPLDKKFFGVYNIYSGGGRYRDNIEIREEK
jgi:hypothetical protein